MLQEARAELDRVRDEGLDALRPALWLASLTYLADACSIVGDAGMARLVYAELLPHSGSSVMIGHAVACYGAADRYLGMLAAAFGDGARAAAPFRGGARARPPGGRAHLVRPHRLRVRAAAPRRRSGGRRRAGRTSSWPRRPSSARRIGMRALLERIQPPGAAPVATPSGLSPREVEILRLVARGLSNREVGRVLSISEHTAANHIRSILRKTGAANRTEAAAYAHANGLIAE